MSKNETEKTSSNWTLQDSIDTYGFTSWARDFYASDLKGNVVIRCGNANIDLFFLHMKSMNEESNHLVLSDSMMY